MKTAKAPQDPNPVDGAPVANCPHKRAHTHGTRMAYTTCGCRCTYCRTVENEAQRIRREEAHKATPAGRMKANAKAKAAKNHTTHVPTPQDESHGTWLSTEPNTPPSDALAAVRVVLHHVGADALARDIVECLGLRRLATAARSGVAA